MYPMQGYLQIYFSSETRSTQLDMTRLFNFLLVIFFLLAVLLQFNEVDAKPKKHHKGTSKAKSSNGSSGTFQGGGQTYKSNGTYYK